MAFVFSILIGIPIGIISAIKQDTIADYAGRITAIGGISMPDFWLGTMVLVFPAIWWGYQPPIGYHSPLEDPWGNFQQFIIPALVVGFRGAASDMRLTRSQMLEVLRQDYIRTARAKGLTERMVILRHALRNAIIPVLTLWGSSIARILGGTVIIEQIFTLPGVGLLTFSSITLRDYTQIQTNVLILAFFILFGNLLTDISYGVVDPRIRYR
jgi:peptide/nickel transport system permease protein